MAERYTTVYLLPEYLYKIGAPITIAAGALLKDNQKSNMIAQLKIKNIGSKTIKALKVRIVSCDTVGRELNRDTHYQYLDLEVKRDETFGEQTPIILPDNDVRSYHVCILEVAFSDNTVWTGGEEKWETAIAMTPLSKKLEKPELQEQYRIATELPAAAYEPLSSADLWVCACGAINHVGESECHICKKSLHNLKNALDKETLTVAAEERLAIAREKEEVERAERERKTAIAKQQRDEKAKQTKKVLKIAVPIITVIAVLFFAITNILTPSSKYDEAVALIDAGNYQEARKMLANMSVLSGGMGHTVGLKVDGTVVAVGDNEYGQCNVENWKDIVAVSEGSLHTVGLKADGTVVAVGSNGFGQCNVEDWKDIISLSSGSNHTVGVKADGTVVAVGNNEASQCNLGRWKDIVAVSAGTLHTVGLKADGTVVAVGDNEYGQCDVEDWKDIVAISTGIFHTVGLKADGTVVAVGNNGLTEYGLDFGQCAVTRWEDTVSVSAEAFYTVGLKTDGTVVKAGSDYPLIIMGYEPLCDVEDWKDIVAVSAGTYHIVGLKADGTVVAVGDNDYGQCDVKDWNLFQ